MEDLCVIFGAGETHSPRKSFGTKPLVVAADGGYEHACRFGFEPDVVVGDFDSGACPETAAHVIKLSCDKDDTDTLAAVKLGLRRGCKRFVIYGGVGGRLDHTLANIATLYYLNAYGAHGYLIDRDSVATVITDEKLTLPKTAHGTVSIFAYGGAAAGVTVKNLKFPLDDAELSPDFPLGISNETVGDPAEISVKHGSLLIFFPRSL